MHHNFHIPVMGIAFTIDTPIRVAHYGINSVISIIEDSLLEKVRETYCVKYGEPYTPVKEVDEDSRALRVTLYLNLVKKIVNNKILRFKQSCTLLEAMDYLDLYPDKSKVKKNYLMLKKRADIDQIINYARQCVRPGSIDVNVMTKLDKTNYTNGKPLPRLYNDAHASVRGFAKSDLNSSLVLSAGLNPSLFGYLSEFEDFYPDQYGFFKKRIILKVSDYRSAMVQGKFLAKKGLWVSEFRIESGLNCGGHAFGTDGYLMGPILEEFKNERTKLQETIFETYQAVLAEKGVQIQKIPEMKITAQGGVGTSSEHAFLIEHYQLDAVGWGSPFLLVPEATCLDLRTRDLVKNAREDDVYLSEISPLGVPFHNLKSNTKDLEKNHLASQGRPGSPCIKKYLSFNTEFTEKPICTASRKYQNLKIKELQRKGLHGSDYDIAYEKIIEKACICTGLGTSFLIENKLSTKQEGNGVSICPGPNIAYFDRVVSLREMIDHIYGRASVMSHLERPHMFTKELGLYLDRLKKLVDDFMNESSALAEKKIQSFISNIKDGITYYQNLLPNKLNLSQREEGAFSDFLEFAQVQITVLSAQYDSKKRSIEIH